LRSLKRQAEGLSAPIYSERRHVYGFAISGIEESKVRFWRSRGVQSQQIKCFTYAVAVDLIVQVLSEYVLDGPITALLLLLVAPLVPTAVGIAVLHYRLYDIDILVNRTLVYGSLTAMLVALYLGCVATAQAIFRTLTGQEEQPQLAIVVSTLVIAALITPLRRRIQSFMDRRFYRSKYDAKKILEAFSGKLREETNLAALDDALVGVVSETMQPAHVSLWLRPDTVSKKGEQTN
jgi:sensor histidine kinase YesM